MSEFIGSTSSHQDGSSTWSRRRLLLSGLAGVSAVTIPAVAGLGAAPGLPGSAASAALPTVRPISSHAAYSALGVCALPHLGNSPYRFTSDWMGALAQTGASYFRGMYAHQISATAVATREARRHGLKWGMTVCPDLSFPDSMIVARIRHIANNAADLCLFIEGINEPNHSRGGGGVPSDWARRAVAKQRVIWQAVQNEPRLSHVPVLSPKLQSVVGTESHYRALASAGIVQYMDMAALACYPGGKYPFHLLDERLGWIRQHWGNKRAWITETGYTNATRATRGHAVVPEDVAADYAPSMLLEAVERGCSLSLFELLDSPNAAKDDTEDNFGLFATIDGESAPWRPKPITRSLRSFLDSLKDPGPAYTPAPVALSVVSAANDVQSTVTAKRNGEATVHLRRARDVWDPSRKVRLSVPDVAVRISTPSGTRTVMVDHRVSSVSL